MTEAKDKQPNPSPALAPPPASGGGWGVGKSGIVMGYHAAEKRERARQLRQTMTRAERILWQRVRANRLGGLPFRRQQVIDGFIADFYCHTAGLVIEIDGAVHAGQVAYDAERDRILATRGLRILRLTNERVLNDCSACLSEILAAAGNGPPPTPPDTGGERE